MHRSLATAALFLLLAGSLALVACGEDGSENFTEGDLSGLVLTPTEGPEGLVYGRQQSGANALEKEGEESGIDLEKLQEFGFAGDYGSQFFSTNPTSGIQFSESLALVFDDEDGAQQALDLLEEGQRKLDEGAEDVSAEGLGDDSWGLRGVFFPKAPPTYFYAWRVGNVVQVFAIAGSPDSVSEDDARASADGLEAKAG